ncbi:MAG TPA: VWA domain-containing protein [Bryobacteraceae bacterium]|jgi:VWFA-related protein
MIGLLLAIGLCAQTAPAFKVTAPLVLVPASVKDAQGHTIEGLNETDFVILDNGIERHPSLEFTLAPVSLTLVIEANKRSGAVLRKVQKIGSLIQPLVLGLHGTAAVVTFADHVRVWQEFTSRAGVISESLKTIEPQGSGSRMHDALAKAVDMLIEQPDRRRRKIIIVVSESKDHASETKLEDLVTRAQAANIVVYPLTYSVYASAFTSKGGERFGTNGEGDLVYDSGGIPGFQGIFTELAAASKENSHGVLAKYTGGEHWQFTKLEGLEQVIQRVAQDLHSQYLLSFTPPLPTPNEAQFHRVEVRVKGHPEAVAIRTRPGYWPAGSIPTKN